MDGLRNEVQADNSRMYIREVARHLYQLKRRLEELEQAHEGERSGAKRVELELELHRVREEYRRVKNVLEGSKGQ